MAVGRSAIGKGAIKPTPITFMLGQVMMKIFARLLTLMAQSIMTPCHRNGLRGLAGTVAPKVLCFDEPLAQEKSDLACRSLFSLCR